MPHRDRHPRLPRAQRRRVIDVDLTLNRADCSASRAWPVKSVLNSVDGRADLAPAVAAAIDAAPS